MQALLSIVSSYIISPAVTSALLLAGGYFIISSGGFPLRNPRKIARSLKKGGGASSLRALALALSGTLGVGNITGVASAMISGGPGALFWMEVSALFAATLKFAETALALDRRKYLRGRLVGGAMYYIKNRLPACLFALFCLVCAVMLGGVLQVRAAHDAVLLAFGGEAARLLLVIFTAASAFAILGGKRIIEGAASFIIPCLTLFYAALSLFIIISNRENLPTAISSIFASAFGIRPIVGGAFGYGIMRAVRFGVSRGLVSNEAGCGSAPLAHATSQAASPVSQGVMGMIEVFVDTSLLCTLTGLALLTSGVEFTGGSMEIVFAAFAGSGSAAISALAISIVLFAYATVICWYFYGGIALEFLSGSRVVRAAYAALFLASLTLGGYFSEELIWCVTDIALGGMTLINLAALLANRRRILGYMCDCAK